MQLIKSIFTPKIERFCDFSRNLSKSQPKYLFNQKLNGDK